MLNRRIGFSSYGLDTLFLLFSRVTRLLSKQPKPKDKIDNGSLVGSEKNVKPYIKLLLTTIEMTKVTLLAYTLDWRYFTA